MRADSLVGAILVSWQPPTDAGPQITGYVVIDESTGASQTTTGATITGFYSLLGGSTHCFRVYAIAPTGRSAPAPQPSCARAWSAEVAPPTNVRALAIPLGARVSWDPPLPNPGPPEGTYLVESDPGAVRAGGDAEHRSVDILGLTEGTTYTFKVSAFAGGGAIGQSVWIRTNPVTIETRWPAGTWRQGRSLPTATSLAGFVLGPHIFFIADGEIDSAPLDASGAPGAWDVRRFTGIGAGSSSSYALSTGDGRTGFLYVSGGGVAPDSTSGAVWVAAVSADGSTSAFRETTPLSPGRRSHATVAVDQRLYAVGGAWWSGGSFTGIGSPLAFVEVADIHDDGTLGAWRKTAPLPPRRAWQAAAYGHRLYAVAVHGQGADVMIGRIGPDGGIDVWTRASAQPGWALGSSFKLAATNGFLYLLGGTALTADGRQVATASVAVGRIGPDGDLTSWELAAEDSFNGPRRDPAIAAGDGTLYLAGGGFSDLQWAVIDPATGHLAKISPPPRTRPPAPPRRVLATPGNGSVALAWDPPGDDGGLPVSGYAVIGGPDRIDAGLSRSAEIDGLQNGASYMFQVVARNAAGEGNASGPIDDVTPSASAFWREFRPSPGGYVSQAVMFAGEELFFAGARGATAPLDEQGVPWTLIGPGYYSDHPRNSWAQAVVPRGASGVCAYEVGGNAPYHPDGTTIIECIDADGFIGNAVPAPQPSSVLSPARLNGAAVVAGSWLYALGGTMRPDPDQNTSRPLDDVSFAPILDDGNIGSWVHTSPLPEATDAPVVVVYRGNLYLIGPRAVLRASPAADGALHGWTGAGRQLPAPESGGKAAVIGDIVYFVGETSGALLIGRFDPLTGDVISWESEPAEALPERVLGIAPAPGRLYLWTADTLAVAHLDPDSGHPIRWR